MSCNVTGGYVMVRRGIGITVNSGENRVEGVLDGGVSTQEGSYPNSDGDYVA